MSTQPKACEGWVYVRAIKDFDELCIDPDIFHTQHMSRGHNEEHQILSFQWWRICFFSTNFLKKREMVEKKNFSLLMLHKISKILVWEVDFILLRRAPSNHSTITQSEFTQFARPTPSNEWYYFSHNSTTLKDISYFAGVDRGEKNVLILDKRKLWKSEGRNKLMNEFHNFSNCPLGSELNE